MQGAARTSRQRAFRDDLNGFGAERLISIVACWTVAYWVALALGFGWILALPLAVAGFVALQLFVFRSGVHGANDVLLRRRDDRPDTVALLIVLALTLGWPAIDQWGRPALLAVVAVGIGVRLLIPLARRSFDPVDAVVLGGVVIVGAISVLLDRTWIGWTLLVMVVAAVAVAIPDRVGLDDLTGDIADDRSDDPGAIPVMLLPGSFTAQRWVSSFLLAALGAVLAVWHIGTSFWNGDNTYYVSKATSYGESARSFGTDDHLFGIDGLRHVPYGNLLSAFEPAIGVAARLSGLSPSTMLFNIVAPASMLLLPFALRWSARQLGQRDPDLIAGIGAASILLMTELTSYNLFSKVSLAKVGGLTILVPMLFAAMAGLAARPHRRAAVLALLLCIATVGASPSLGLAVVLCTGAFAAAEVVRLLLDRSDGRSRNSNSADDSTNDTRERLWVFLPAVFGLGFALFARAFQDSAGAAQFVGGFSAVPNGEIAWVDGQLRGLPSALTLGLVGGVLLLAIPLLVRPEQRRGLALLLFGLFGVLLAPWSYDLLVVDTLNIDYFANRLVWAIPVPLLLGIVVAGVDVRPTLRWLTVACAVLLFGAAGRSIAGTQLEFLRPVVNDVTDAPLAWPWQTDDFLDRNAAYRILEETPDGGTYLAPPNIEAMATGLRQGVDARPTYARLQYLQTLAADPTTPESFRAQDRLILQAAINGKPRPSAAVLRALDVVSPDVVCLGVDAIVELVDAVAEGYESKGFVGGRLLDEDAGFGPGVILDGCDLWIKRGG